MASVSLADADKIIDATIEKGVDMGLAPLSVAVLDVGGNLVAFKKSDGSSLLRFEIALGKAWSALAMFTSSKQLGDVWQERPQFVTALMNASGGRIVPVPGGVLLRNSDGGIIGAVGVTGDTSDNDEIAGRHGIEAAGLRVE